MGPVSPVSPGGPRLSGKVALVTGAARGIGRATAVAFAREGADLMLVDIAADLPGVPYPLGSASQLAHTAELCRETGAAVRTARVDVRDLAAVETAVKETTARFGRLDVLVNNAGIAAPSGRAAHEIEEHEWQLMLDVDLSGAWRTIRAAGALMTARGSRLDHQHRLHGRSGRLPPLRRVRRRQARPDRPDQGGRPRLRAPPGPRQRHLPRLGPRRPPCGGPDAG